MLIGVFSLNDLRPSMSIPSSQELGDAKLKKRGLGRSLPLKSIENQRAAAIGKMTEAVMSLEKVVPSNIFSCLLRVGIENLITATVTGRVTLPSKV